MRPARTLSFLAAAALLCVGCSDGTYGGWGDAGSDTATSLDAADDAEEPLLNLPRPLDWALGVWTGSMPAESTPGVASMVAGKAVRLQITAPGSAVSAPEEGYHYAGTLTWDQGGAGQWSITFDASGLGVSYARWLYYPDLHAESWDIAAVHGAASLTLDTTFVGSTGERPTEMVMDWTVRDGAAVDETNGYTITTRLHLTKQ